MSDFERALRFVLDVEGPPSNRPLADDPGGETVYGLARRYNRDMDPWPPTQAQAAERYRVRYWDAIQGDLLPWPVSLVVFDAAVQHAPVTAVQLLQAALRIVADGVLGPATRAALRASAPLEVAEEVIARRGVYYPSLETWAANGLGWSRRLVSLHREALRG